MRAGVFAGAGDIRVAEVPEPAVSATGIVLAVAACGICGSDLHVLNSGRGVPPGQIMGHEFAGLVVEVGADVEGIAVGDRVAAMPMLPCGECRACVRGEVELCTTGFAPGIGFGHPGAFAERVHVPDAKLGATVFALPDTVDLEAAALTEPLAVAVHAVRLGEVAAGDTVAVFGLGAIGHLAGQVLVAGGARRVIGVDVSQLRLDVARRHGIDAVDGRDGAADAVRATLEPGEVVDAVFECSGVPELARSAPRLVRRGGTVMIVAVYETAAPVDVAAFALRQVTVRGSTAYRPRDFARALELLEAGAVSADGIVTHRSPLAELPQAFATQQAADRSVKVVVYP